MRRHRRPPTDRRVAATGDEAPRGTFPNTRPCWALSSVGRAMRALTSPVRGELTSVRPATDADADILVSWHRDPESARYWDNETFTHDEMRARLARRDVDPYVIEADCEPIGYLQVWFGEAPG